MQSGLKNQLLTLSLVFVFAATSLAQYNGQQNQQTGQAAQQGQRQYSTPQLTAEQQAAQQRAADQAYADQLAQSRALANQNKLPEGFPISAEHEQYLGKLLDYWEQSSQRIKKYKCNFRRFSYDNAIVNWRDEANQLAAHQVAFGEVRFASPDRASYKTSSIMKFEKPPAQAGEQASYEKVEDASAQEHWICDGKAIFEFDFVTKKLYETKIPPEMQGNIIESPLPFLFGAKKKDILERYWVRSATPQGVENEYWLVAYPKRVKDSRMYSKVEIILSKEDFLPKAMHMYTPQYDPKKGNEESYYFTFENRTVNAQLDQFRDFFGSFVKPRLPGLGWKRVDLSQNPSQAAAPGGQPATRR